MCQCVCVGLCLCESGRVYVYVCHACLIWFGVIWAQISICKDRINTPIQNVFFIHIGRILAQVEFCTLANNAPCSSKRKDIHCTRVWSVCHGRTFWKFSKFEGLSQRKYDMWCIGLWFIVKGSNKCTRSKINLVAMVTNLHDNPWNVQSHGRTR